MLDTRMAAIHKLIRTLVVSIVCVCSTSPAVAQSKIKVGDCITVTSNDATLRIRDADIAELSKNQILLVEGVNEDWLWVSFKKNDVTFSGWLDRSYVRNHSLVSIKGHRFAITNVLFSPDGKYIASSGGKYKYRGTGEVKLWNATTGNEVFELKFNTDFVTGLAFDPDGRQLIAGGGAFYGLGGELKTWELNEGKELLARKMEHAGRFLGVCCSPDGKRIAAGSTDRILRVWDSTPGKEIMALSGHRATVIWVSFSPSGDRLASSCIDGRISLWDAQTGQSRLTILAHSGRSNKISFSPDGKRLVSAGDDGTLKVWDSTTGHNLLTIEGNQGIIRGVAYSPDGKRLASGGHDNTVKLWDAITGNLLYTLLGHSASVNDIAFDPTGKRVVSAGEDLTVKVWNVELVAQF